MYIYMYMLFMIVCVPVDVHGQSDRCWTSVVMDFNAYWAALPTDGWHRLLAGRSCKVRDACSGQQCNSSTDS